MKGIITGIKRLAVHDGDGLRTTVFFKGCPLRCIWCHNPETYSFNAEMAFHHAKCIGCNSCVEACKCGALTKESYNKNVCIECHECVDACPTNARTILGEEIEATELVNKILQDIEFFKNGNGGVTLSGGECLMQIDFAVEVAKLLCEMGISVDIDTCGYVKRECFERIIPYTDVFLYDLKAIDNNIHVRCTGKDNDIILNNLKYLSESDCKIEIRYPLVMGYNDGECEKIGNFLKGMKGITKLKVLQYHSYASSKFDALGIKNTMPDTITSIEDVDFAVTKLRSFGLNAINGSKED